MKILPVSDPSFAPYGKVLEGYDTTCLLNAMKTIPLPEAGVAYEPSIPALEATCLYGQFQNNAYGGMPVQLGMCWGRNTRLHYAPCHVNETEGFRVAVVLPRGTNTAIPGAAPLNEEDRWLTARNKWLLAHPDSSEAGQGAHVGLKGENIDISGDI